MHWTLVLAFAWPVFAFAQGSGSTAPTTGPRTIGGDMGEAPAFAVTRTLTGKIVGIEAAQNLLVVEDDGGKRHNFKLSKDTRFRADKNTELQGRKHLSLSNFDVGAAVKITYLASGDTATEVRLRRVKG
jgi:hypothetical protein